MAAKKHTVAQAQKNLQEAIGSLWSTPEEAKVFLEDLKKLDPKKYVDLMVREMPKPKEISGDEIRLGLSLKTLLIDLDDEEDVSALIVKLKISVAQLTIENKNQKAEINLMRKKLMK